MLDAKDALNDENVLPNQVLTHAEIGREFKRIRTAEIQSPQGDNPPWIAAMGAVVQQAISDACGSNGTISNAFSNAINTQEIKEEARIPTKANGAAKILLLCFPLALGNFPLFH